MKVLHVVASLQIGGAEKLMCDLLPRLKEYGYDVDLLTLNGAKTSLRTEIEKKGIRVIDFGVKNSVYSLKNLFKLVPLIKKYDIIHTHTTAPQFYVALANTLLQKNLITTEHATSNRRRSWRWFKPIDRWLYNQYKGTICISKIAERNLLKHIVKTKSDVLTINNGIDIKRFFSANPVTDLESIAPESIKILMVAGFRWEKDQDTLIRSLVELPEKFHLFFVGDGVRRANLEELAKELKVYDRVHFMGIRTNVPELLHSADYIVMSSHFEGLSLSSVEGMCVGKPMLASNVDGLKEVVGGYGVLFEEGDYKGFADLIKVFDKDKIHYHEVANKCLEGATQYDIDSMAEAYSNYYKNTICGKEI